MFNFQYLIICFVVFFFFHFVHFRYPTSLNQLNGAELPCGSIIKAQPANFDKKDTSSQVTTDNGAGSSNASTYTSNHIETNGVQKQSIPPGQIQDGDTTKEDQTEKEDDLDDFFDSLG